MKEERVCGVGGRASDLKSCACFRLLLLAFWCKEIKETKEKKKKQTLLRAKRDKMGQREETKQQQNPHI